MVKYIFDIYNYSPEFSLAAKRILNSLDLIKITSEEKAILRRTILDEINTLKRTIENGRA